ncbi:hypothetical protein HYN48_02155 [Flavobacterium magnum]|uniref:Uncharacterized protein n=1 Tax=Flavobacterium magnum TaxID=2162713 RepID=A0A2S0RBC0_9FLAO|nr:hypothetical protein [Flavobacterium magnum]AWA28983.1 hypothetical protein HYN48_02155 [Flavobacterium magnum]
MKMKLKTSNPTNNMAMDDLLKPLDNIREVNPPFFLRDKINARIHRVPEYISPKAAAWACASLAVLCALTLYSAAVPSNAGAVGSIDLMPHNDLYAQP